MQLLPDSTPVGPQIMCELCDVNLWQAATCRDHVIGNNLQRSHQTSSIPGAQAHHSRTHSLKGKPLMEPSACGQVVLGARCPEQPNVRH